MYSRVFVNHFLSKMGFPDGYFYIKSKLNGLVLDVEHASAKPGARVIMWDPKYEDDRDNQLWRYEDDHIVNKASHMALEIKGGDLEHGGQICQNPVKKSASAHNQLFGYDPESGGEIFLLANRRLVIDVSAALLQRGTKVIAYPKKMVHEYRLNQLWVLQPAGELPRDDEILFDIAELDEDAGVVGEVKTGVLGHGLGIEM